MKIYGVSASYGVAGFLYLEAAPGKVTQLQFDGEGALYATTVNNAYVPPTTPLLWRGELPPDLRKAPLIPESTRAAVEAAEDALLISDQGGVCRTEKS